MKFIAVTAAVFASLALAQGQEVPQGTPQFLNTEFRVTEGVPFTLEFSECASGCTIILQEGPETDLQDVETLVTDATGGSADITLTTVPSGSYNFKIVDNRDSSLFNYSERFTYVGSVAPTSASTSAEPSSTEQSTTEATTSESTTTEETTTEETTTAATTTDVSTEATTATETTETTETTVTTGSSSTTSAPETTVTDPASTDIPDPDGAAAGLRMPVAAGAVAAAAFFLL
jgi:hypothetical protein